MADTLARLAARAPVAVIGPREATAAEMAVAEAVGERLARAGYAVLTGGRGGVMEGACRGAKRAGGVTVALLPGTDPAEANPHVDIVIATGLGEMRNALIARAAHALVAVGDSYGTLSEVALGLRMGKRVFGLCGAPRVQGVAELTDPDDLVGALAA